MSGYGNQEMQRNSILEALSTQRRWLVCTHQPIHALITPFSCSKSGGSWKQTDQQSKLVDFIKIGALPGST